MKIKTIITYMLAGVSITSIYLASGIKDIPNWWDHAKPLFTIWFISIIVGLVLVNFNYVRRVTYPAFVCLVSWAYKYQIIKTKFAHNTYLLYKWKGRSYKNLFTYVQDLFDVMYMGG